MGKRRKRQSAGCQQDCWCPMCQKLFTKIVTAAAHTTRTLTLYCSKCAGK